MVVVVLVVKVLAAVSGDGDGGVGRVFMVACNLPRRRDVNAVDIAAR